jgi:hypothetical protein
LTIPLWQQASPDEEEQQHRSAIENRRKNTSGKQDAFVLSRPTDAATNLVMVSGSCPYTKRPTPGLLKGLSGALSV